MADPTAIARAAAQKPQGAMQGGATPDMGPGMGPDMMAGGPPGGVDALVGKLQEVGEFLKAQGDPEALELFKNLLQKMASLGGEGGPPQAPGQAPESPETGGRVPMDKLPGVQVL